MQINLFKQFMRNRKKLKCFQKSSTDHFSLLSLSALKLKTFSASNFNFNFIYFFNFFAHSNIYKFWKKRAARWHRTYINSHWNEALRQPLYCTNELRSDNLDVVISVAVLAFITKQPAKLIQTWFFYILLLIHPTLNFNFEKLSNFN
jgi:hypothetical protein